MSNEFVEFFINDFPKRVGRIRGETLQEKVSYLRGRYLKTAEDCRKEIDSGADTSIYRSAYAAAHEDIGAILVDFDESADYLETEVISHLTNLIHVEEANKTPSSVGYMDAYGYMLAELRKAAEESNV